MASKILTVALVLTTLVLNVTVAQTDFWRTMKKGQLMAADEATLKMAIGEAINGKKTALDKLQLGVKDLKKFRASTFADCKTQVVQVLDKRYKGANAKSKGESEA